MFQFPLQKAQELPRERCEFVNCNVEDLQGRQIADIGGKRGKPVAADAEHFEIF